MASHVLGLDVIDVRCNLRNKEQNVPSQQYHREEEAPSVEKPTHPCSERPGPFDLMCLYLLCVFLCVQVHLCVQVYAHVEAGGQPLALLPRNHPLVLDTGLS